MNECFHFLVQGVKEKFQIHAQLDKVSIAVFILSSFFERAFTSFIFVILNLLMASLEHIQSVQSVSDKVFCHFW